MADARTLTPRTYSRNMYIPEENAEFIAGQQGGENAYERFKRETVENTYNDVLRRTGSPEKAQDAAQSVARKMFRTEMIVSVVAPEAAMTGASGVVNLARSLLGGSRAARSTEAPALLTGPRRNAQTPDEMLDVAPTPSYSGPPRLTSGEFLPRIDIPRVQSSGITARDVVSSPFDDIGRMAGEGGLSDDAIAAARQMARDRVAAEEAFRARQLAQMEGEGGVAVGEAARLRGLRAAEDAALTARQMGTAEGEGMLTADAVQAARAMAQNRLAAEEARRAAEVARFMDEGGGMAMTRPMERASAPPAGRYGVPALRSSTEPAVTGGGGGGAGVPPSSSSFDLGGFRLPPPGGSYGSVPPGASDAGAMLRKLGLTAMGTGATASALNLARDMGGQNASAASPQTEALFALLNRSGAGATAPTPAPSADRYSPFDETNMGAPRFTPEKRDVYEEFSQGAPQFARAPVAAAAAAPARRQEPARAPDPASRALYEAYNRSMMEEGGGRADLFERARRAEMEEQGRARGGAARGGGGKDAALHKALEIIQHMLVNR
jgi:hypothetical protein